MTNDKCGKGEDKLLQLGSLSTLRPAVTSGLWVAWQGAGRGLNKIKASKMLDPVEEGVANHSSTLAMKTP